MKFLEKYKLNFIFLLAFFFVILNIKVSRRFYFGYSLLENPSDSRWEKILEALGKQEREKYFACCVDKKLKEKLNKTEVKEKEKIVKLEQALRVNPYNWQVMLELSKLYRKQGEYTKALEVEKKLKRLFPDIEKVKSLSR